MDSVTCLNSRKGRGWWMVHGDCVEVLRQMPSDSVDLFLFSPPFANVYTYSASERDMGNVDNPDHFIEGYSYVAAEITRVLKPGRLCVVHCKDTVKYAGSHGRAGLVDLPGMLCRAHEMADLQYHSRVTLWTNPVREMQKTKAHGLLYKQLRTDSTFSRQGMPEYLVVLRKWARDEREAGLMTKVPHLTRELPLNTWQEWASPVWMDWDAKDTLNVKAARDDADEKHMCPLSLDVIRRCAVLWSNPGDLICSPFGGVGSEGVGALRLRRKFVGVELKESYWRRACLNLEDAEGQEDLFT